MYLKLIDFEKYKSMPNIRFIQESVNGRQFIIVAYEYMQKGGWEKAWEQDPVLFETRGIVFDEAGELVALPFKKFFRVNEKYWTNWESFDSSSSYHCAEKLDGSMVTPLVVGQNIFWKTKKSFQSFVAKTLQESVLAKADFVVSIVGHCLEQKLTPCFEYISPSCSVAVDYKGQEILTLIGLRCLNTGRVFSMVEVYEWAKQVGVEQHCVKPVTLTKAELVNIWQNSAGIEGYVIEPENKPGEFMKIKTKWYDQVHSNETDLRTRDLAQIVVDEKEDDLIASVNSTSTGDVKDALIADINRIADQVHAELEAIRHRIMSVVEDIQKQNLPKKQAYELVKLNEHQKTILQVAFGLMDEERLCAYIKKAWASEFKSKYNLQLVSTSVYARNTNNET